MSENVSEKIPVSVFIITQNEEQHIENVIKSCQQFDEIIVVDSGSTDTTKQIAESLGAKVIHNDWPGYAKQKQYAMSLCKHDWVLNLDADEELTAEFIHEIKNFIQQDEYIALKCRRNDFFLGHFFPRSIRLPTNTRLFKKDHIQYYLDNLVHEGPEIKGKIKHTPAAFKHYGYADIETLSKKYEYYSSLKAQEKFNKGKKPSRLKLLLVAPLEFIRVYLIYRYCFAGLRGFIFAKLSAQYAFLKEAKLYSYHQSDKHTYQKNAKQVNKHD
ncbi:glycosyltransferase family 2 protein [Kangiella sp.]|uniref:glycosyltransferase family 2 protein n=1 Tax=Kangiella sp. TaxID=1920245 RepID=UPI003A9533A4